MDYLYGIYVALMEKFCFLSMLN